MLVNKVVGNGDTVVPVGLLVLCAALALGAPGAHAHEAATSSCVETAKAQPSSLEKIAPGVFVRVGEHALMTAENLGAISNAGFVIGEKFVAVIDTGGSYCDGLRLKAALREKTDLPIKYVINTHVHPDHIFGNAAFAGEGVEIVGHEKLPRSLAERGKFYLSNFERLMGKEALNGTVIVPPTITVKDRLQLDLGGRKLTLQAHATAHTDNDLTVFDETTGTLFTGDLVFQGHLPVIDGKLLGWQKSLEHLSNTPAKRAVPGHGPASIGWPEGAQPQIRYLQVLTKDLRAFIGDGLFMQEAQSKAAQSESKKWELFDEFNARNVAAGFAELEWE